VINIGLVLCAEIGQILIRMVQRRGDAAERTHQWIHCVLVLSARLETVKYVDARLWINFEVGENNSAILHGEKILFSNWLSVE